MQHYQNNTCMSLAKTKLDYLNVGSSLINYSPNSTVNIQCSIPNATRTYSQSNILSNINNIISMCFN